MHYYGELPGYFDLWLKTAGNNHTIDFYIITDIKSIGVVPKNIHVIQIGFDDLKKRVQALFDFKISMNEPYKICDYRPAFGLIFNGLVKNYDFWGYCDPDVIWGNLRAFITEDILKCYDKIYSRGHLTLYKNTAANNNIFKELHKIRSFNYKEAFTTEYICHFDEWGGISCIYENKKISCYDTIDFADIRYQKYHFELAPPMDADEKPKVFIWANGKLFGYILGGYNIIKKEYSYIHLQKRPMKCNAAAAGNSFLITPEEFIPFDGEPSKELMHKYSAKKILYFSYWKIRAKMIWRQLLAGAVKQRLRLLLKQCKGYSRVG